MEREDNRCLGRKFQTCVHEFFRGDRVLVVHSFVSYQSLFFGFAPFHFGSHSNLMIILKFVSNCAERGTHFWGSKSSVVSNRELQQQFCCRVMGVYTNFTAEI